MKRLAWLLAGALPPCYLVSLASGGYVILLNDVAVRLASDPLAPLAFRLALVAYPLILLAPLFSRLAEVAETTPLGFFAEGLVYALLANGVLAAIAYDVGLAIFLIVALIGSAVYLLNARMYRRLAYTTILASLLIITLVILYLYKPVASAHEIRVVTLEEPIDVNGLYRFIPLMTAYAYALDRLQVPTHTIYAEDSYVYYMGNHSVYNWIIEPEGLWNQLTREPLGIILVYGDVYPPHVEVVEKRLYWGLHNMRFQLLYFDTLQRQVILAAGLGYRPLLEDNIEVYVNGSVYILVPLVEWKRGLLYSIPVLHGYAVIHEDGRIEVLEPDEVASRFPFIPLLPEAVAREWVEILRYKPGFVQVYIYHNTFVIRDVGTNPQPYLTRDLEGRQWWVFIAEPAGHTYSAKYIIYVPVNASTPTVYLYELPKPVIGVSMVSSYVKQAHPRFDWEQLSIEEPIPVIIGGRVYWKVTVTTRDHRGLVTVDVVDAETTKVYSIAPKHAMSYLDVLNAITAGKAITTEKPSVQELIESMRERLERLQKEVQELLEQLERLEKLVANVTRGQWR